MLTLDLPLVALGLDGERRGAGISVLICIDGRQENNRIHGIRSGGISCTVHEEYHVLSVLIVNKLHHAEQGDTSDCKVELQADSKH